MVQAAPELGSSSPSKLRLSLVLCAGSGPWGCSDISVCRRKPAQCPCVLAADFCGFCDLSADFWLLLPQLHLSIL